MELAHICRIFVADKNLTTMDRQLAIRVLARKTYEYVLQAGKPASKANAVKAYVKCSHLEEAFAMRNYWRQVAAKHITFNKS